MTELIVEEPEGVCECENSVQVKREYFGEVSPIFLGLYRFVQDLKLLDFLLVSLNPLRWKHANHLAHQGLESDTSNIIFILFIFLTELRLFSDFVFRLNFLLSFLIQTFCLVFHLLLFRFLFLL